MDDLAGTERQGLQDGGAYWFLAVFSGIRGGSQWLAGGHTRSHPFLKGHGTEVWKPASRSSAWPQQAWKPALRRLAGPIPKSRVPGQAGSTRGGARGRG